MLEFGRDVTGLAQLANGREWLVTNGIGGYASGTISGALTRVYHGLLVAALDLPLGRTVLLSKIDEIASYDGHDYELFSNQWVGDDLNPQGSRYLERFWLDGTVPVWEFVLADALLEKRVWMAYGENTTYIQYRLLRGSAPLYLALKMMVNYKDAHAVTEADDWHMKIDEVERGLHITASDSAVPFVIVADHADVAISHQWYNDYYLADEKARGLPHVTDHLHAGTFEAVLQPGESVTLVASTNDAPALPAETAYQDYRSREQRLIKQSRLDDAPEWIQQLVLAADQFVVRRPTDDEPQGRTIIAGYHWFGDWGRDTMIALPGLTLTTNRHDDAARILRTFAKYVDRGMLPNRFPDDGHRPEYNTVDATLWYINAIQEYYNATGDTDLLRDLFPTLQAIIMWHRRGTRYDIHVDKDGLLYAGRKGSNLTWMDAKIEDWVVTPRTGKAVEINALWYNALRAMADISRLLGELDADEYDTLANQVENSFQKFWNDDAGYCYDVIDTPDRSRDAALRPNQLFAVSLEYSPLTAEQQQAVVDVCARQLWTPLGLRSLAPDHADYKGDYGGTPYERDSRYHQGTVWPWLVGAFVAAHLSVYDDGDAALAFLESFRLHLRDACIGTISEVAQGDPPHTPKAAVAQAWSVAEVLRVWVLAQDYR